MEWETKSTNTLKVRLAKVPRFPMRSKWRRWFAWRPVACAGDVTVWLKTVERIGRSSYIGGGLWANYFHHRQSDQGE